MSALPTEVPELLTARLLLSQPTRADAEAIVSLIGDWEVARWLGRVPHPYTLADAHHFLDDIVPALSVWSIRTKEARDLMGIVSLSAGDLPAPELGYWLGRPFWGQGYMTEAARSVVAFACETGLSSLCSGYFVGNERSAQVLTKIGFEPIGQSERPSASLGRFVTHIDMELRCADLKG